MDPKARLYETRNAGRRVFIEKPVVNGRRMSSSAPPTSWWASGLSRAEFVQQQVEAQERMNCATTTVNLVKTGKGF